MLTLVLQTGCPQSILLAAVQREKHLLQNSDVDFESETGKFNVQYRAAKWLVLTRKCKWLLGCKACHSLSSHMCNSSRNSCL